MTDSPDVLVLGAGMIGVTVAWRCARRGLRVVVIDPAAQAGAWRTAAGMLAPVTELQFTESPLLRLNLAAAAGYPDFLAELADVVPLPTGFRRDGALDVAWDAADLTLLRELRRFGAGLGLDARMLTSAELRASEPQLAAGLPGALFTALDGQVDPRLLHAALRRALQLSGVPVITAEPRLRIRDERVCGVTLGDGSQLAAAAVVLAAGAWSGEVAGLPGPARPPVRPVKGQTLRLRLPGPPRLQHLLRGRIRGAPIYLVPRADGEIIVGASSEEAGFDVAPRAGAVYELLRDAQSLLPELGEAELVEVRTGLRPGSPDNAPLVGRSPIAGLSYACGHYRNGVLLAPITADAVADQLITGALPEPLRAFTAERFTREPVG